VVRVRGDFDMTAVQSFLIEVERAAAMADEAVVVDLRSLEFIDSSGLRAVLDGHAVLADRRLNVTFLPPPPRLLRLFAVTGIDRLLPFGDAPELEPGPPGDSPA
jgi:anti-sigma B factor antagonist